MKDKFQIIINKIGRSGVIALASVLCISLVVVVGLQTDVMNYFGAAGSAGSVAASDDTVTGPKVSVASSSETKDGDTMRYKSILILSNGKFSGNLTKDNIKFNDGYKTSILDAIKKVNDTTVELEYHRPFVDRANEGLTGTISVLSNVIKDLKGGSVEKVDSDTVIDDYIYLDPQILESAAEGKLVNGRGVNLNGMFGDSIGKSDQAQLDDIQKAFNTGKDYLEKGIGIGKKLIEADLFSADGPLGKILDGLGKLGPALGYIGIAFSVASFIFSLFADNSEVDPVMTEIQKLQEQLSKVSDQVDNATIQIMGQVDKNSLLTIANNVLTASSDMQNTFYAQYLYEFQKNYTEVLEATGASLEQINFDNLKAASAVGNVYKNAAKSESAPAYYSIQALNNLFRSIHHTDPVNNDKSTQFNGSYYSAFMKLLDMYNGTTNAKSQDVFTVVEGFASYEFDWNNQTFETRKNFLEAGADSVSVGYLPLKMALDFDVQSLKETLDFANDAVTTLEEINVCDSVKNECLTKDITASYQAQRQIQHDTQIKIESQEKNIEKLAVAYQTFQTNMQTAADKIEKEVAEFTPYEEATAKQRELSRIKPSWPTRGMEGGDGFVYSYRTKQYYSRQARPIDESCQEGDYNRCNFKLKVKGTTYSDTVSPTTNSPLICTSDDCIDGPKWFKENNKDDHNIRFTDTFLNQKAWTESEYRIIEPAARYRGTTLAAELKTFVRGGKFNMYIPGKDASKREQNTFETGNTDKWWVTLKNDTFDQNNEINTLDILRFKVYNQTAYNPRVYPIEMLNKGTTYLQKVTP